MIVVIIALSIVVSIILVTAYEVIKSRRSGGGPAHVQATSSFYTLPRQRTDTRKIKGDVGNDLADLNSCSYAFWVRPNRSSFTGNVNNDWTVFYRGKGGNNEKYITVSIGRHGALKIDVKGNTGTITLQSAIEIRRWNHVVICLDNLEKFVEIYINGELLDTRYVSNIVIDGGSETSPLKINPDNREGYVQRMKYYPDVIGSEQVASLYSGDKFFTNLGAFFTRESGSDSVSGSVIGNLKGKCGELESNKSNTERIRQIYEDGITKGEIEAATTDALKCKIDFNKTTDAAGNSVDSRYICFESQPTCVGYEAAKMVDGIMKAEVFGTCQ